MAAIAIAADRGLTVLATTRQQAKHAGAEVAAGAQHVVVSAGDVTAAVRELLPGGVDGICELIGPGALLQALPALAPGGKGVHDGVSGG